MPAAKLPRSRPNGGGFCEALHFCAVGPVQVAAVVHRRRPGGLPSDVVALFAVALGASAAVMAVIARAAWVAFGRRESMFGI